MTDLLRLILPEMLLTAAALVLILLGVGKSPMTRKVSAAIALIALVAAFFVSLLHTGEIREGATLADRWNVVRLYEFGQYIKLLSCAVGVLLVLLAWPSDADATGNPSLRFGTEGSEFFALMLLSLSGILLTASANDMILLFLALELASIPAYVMVSISRPVSAAQEAGVKYFFLGAMAAAVMLFGFSYLYGTTGTTSLQQVAEVVLAGKLTTWQMLAVVMLLLGLAFKIAAFPLHFYAGDVYQGAATPVTAFLAFTPKTTGFVAIIKILFAVTAGTWVAQKEIASLLWILAVLTMTVGNVLGLLQYNVKRVLAYSSIAHSGYMLVGITALLYAYHSPTLRADEVATIQNDALQGVLFYLAAYGITNAAAFGVIMLLPSREMADGAAKGTSAETFEDLAGTGRKHPGLGLAMAIACFSLTGLPLTIGFFGKLYLIWPALQIGGSAMVWLVVLTVINAAISAGYYLRIVATMFLRPEPEPFHPVARTASTAAPVAAAVGRRLLPAPIVASIFLSVLGTLAFGIILPATGALSARTDRAAVLEGPTPAAASLESR
jgi:NADH-quinone oxidoreductase subunit N